MAKRDRVKEGPAHYGAGECDIYSMGQDAEIDFKQEKPRVSKRIIPMGIISRTPMSAPDRTPVSAPLQKTPTLICRAKNLERGFAQIPNAILKATWVSVVARLLYCLMLSYAWKEDRCFPGQQRLAEDLGVDERTVRRTLAELNEQGLISWKRQGLGLTNIYYIEDLPERFCAKAQEDVELPF